MTTELVLLLFLFVFIILGSFLNSDSGIEAVLRKSGPKLGARIEKHLETGTGFKTDWRAPPKR